MLRNTKESDETFHETSAKLLRNILFVRTLPAERLLASFRFELVGNRYTIGRSRYRFCGAPPSLSPRERWHGVSRDGEGMKNHTVTAQVS